ncbi:MAG TPA: dihydroorotase [bacterium]
MSAKLIIAGGRVLDPAGGRDGAFDLIIERGTISEVRPANGAAANGAKVIDARGKLVVPGLVDLHTHLREPGREDKETIATGLAAAVRGGFTAVCAMPNTEPAMDSQGPVEFLRQEAGRVGLAAVHPIGAATRGRQGKELTDFGELIDAGCIGWSDDGSAVADSFLMRRALEYARVFGRPVIQHAEDASLAAGGVMHEGRVSTILGLRGIPAECESVIVARDLALAELTGGWLHVAHVSTARSVELIREAKRRGVRVTCEATPHHLSLTDEAVMGFNTHAKVNPPLRQEEDREALIAALADGTIDCIATDHAPHTEWEKSADFASAPFGISGIETALAVCIETLVVPGRLTWAQLIERMAVRPSEIATGRAATLAPGAEADVTIIDPDARWTVDPAAFASKGRHSPFAGRTLTGRAAGVVIRGRLAPAPAAE